MGRQCTFPFRHQVARLVKRKAQKPVILSGRAGDAYGAGVPFYRGNDQVWLADIGLPSLLKQSAEGT